MRYEVQIRCNAQDGWIEMACGMTRREASLAYSIAWRAGVIARILRMTAKGDRVEVQQ